MALNSVRHPDGAIGRLSRRSLLKGVTALTAAAASAPWMPASAWGGTILAYVGTYSNHGEGIYLFSVDTSTGALTKIKVFPSVVNPSWLAFSPDRRFLYSANEISNFNGTPTGSVTSYAVNPSNGDLTALNTVTSGGAG